MKTRSLPPQLHPRCLPLQYYLQTTVTADDYVRLGPHLKSWEHLSALLVLKQFSHEDLKKLLLLELHGQRRQQLLLKLRSRLMTAESKHIQTLISNASS